MIMAILGLIPGLSSLAQGILTAWFNSKVQMYQARANVTRDVAVAAITAEVQSNQAKVGWITALAGNPIMMFVVVGFAFPYIAYEWKAILYDKVIMGGTTSTDVITGPLADWAQVILGGIFVTSTGIGVAHTVIAGLNR